MLWSFSITLLLYIVLRSLHLLRVSPSDEKIGLDMATHNEKAYDQCDTKTKHVTPITATGY
jgi:ammonia channel protein AmtB